MRTLASWEHYHAALTGNHQRCTVWAELHDTQPLSFLLPTTERIYKTEAVLAHAEA